MSKHVKMPVLGPCYIPGVSYLVLTSQIGEMKTPSPPAGADLAPHGHVATRAARGFSVPPFRVVHSKGSLEKEARG